jgi:hypothetical protein
MNTPVGVALVGLMAGAVSAAVALIVSRLQINSEREKLRQARIQEVGIRLFEKRAACYPELYGQLHSFYKTLRFGRLERVEVDRMFRGLGEWSVEYGIFHNEAADFVSFWLYHELLELRELSDAEIEALSYEKLKRIGQLVLALKLRLQGALGSASFLTPVTEYDFQQESSYSSRDERYTEDFKNLPDPFGGGLIPGLRYQR